MNITWEDRKNRGTIDGASLPEKPVFSFEYAWFLVTDETAQYVESHELGVYNQDMTAEMRQEVVEYYNAWAAPIAPELTLAQVKANGIQQVKDEATTQSQQPITIESVSWTAGDGSASAIAGAVTLAQNLGETTATLWDADNINHEGVTFEEAASIAAQIAVAWRTIMFERNTKIAAINAATAIDEVNTVLEG